MILLTCFLAFLVLASSAFGVQADGAVSIEWAHLEAFPEAQCSKVHLYIRNDGSTPAIVEGIYLNDKFLDLDYVRRGVLDLAECGIVPSHVGHKAPLCGGKPLVVKTGDLQWCRALPNPIEPGRVAEVTVSLWGALTSASIRIQIGGGRDLRWNAVESKCVLRLSHIAFAPDNPNKVYVYCRNRSNMDVVVDHVLVDTEKCRISRSIPAGSLVKAGGVACFVVYPRKAMTWGRYVGVGVVSRGGAKAVSVVRIINLFPVGSWSVDTRPEMFFDSVDLRMSAADTDKPSRDIELAEKTTAVAVPSCQAYYDGGDPTCDKRGWHVGAERIKETMRRTAHSHPRLPYYTHVCQPREEAVAYFGGLPDIVLMNPYTMLLRPVGPERSAQLIELGRRWSDPRPIVTVPEAFKLTTSTRNLTPDEVSYAMWNEIAAGSKGVRYYTRFPKCPERGYDGMPGVGARIAWDNLNLQLLKEFLCIGDALSETIAETGEVACRSILCGDKGIVFIALRRPSRQCKGAVPQWAPVTGTTFSAVLPDGVQAGGLFEVDAGLRRVPMNVVGGSISFDIDAIIVRRIYLLLPQSLCVQDAGKAEGGQLASRGSAVPLATETAKLYQAYVRSNALRLLDPRRRLTLPELLRSGLELGEARAEARRMMRLCETKAVSGSRSRTPAALTEIAGAYRDMGMLRDARMMLAARVPELSGDSRAALGSALASIHAKNGEYADSCRALEDILSVVRRPKRQCRVLEQLADICERYLLEYDRAEEYLVRALEVAGSDASEFRRLELRLAHMLVVNGKHKAAIAKLRKCNEVSQDGSIDYLLGIAFLRESEWERAAYHLRRVVQCKYERADRAQYLVALIHLWRTQYSEARESLAFLIGSFPESNYAAEAEAMLKCIPQQHQEPNGSAQE